MKADQPKCELELELLWVDNVHQWFLDFGEPQNPLEGLLKQLLGPDSGVSDSAGLGWAWEFAFLTASRCCCCCCSGEHTLRTADARLQKSPFMNPHYPAPQYLLSTHGFWSGSAGPTAPSSWGFCWAEPLLLRSSPLPELLPHTAFACFLLCLLDSVTAHAGSQGLSFS